MKRIFGPQTHRLLTFLTDLRDLSPAEVDRVTSAWKQVRGLDRAEAWAQIQRATTQNERYAILAAASAARRTAMDTAHRPIVRSDRRGGVPCGGPERPVGPQRIGGHYDVLTVPLATVMPSLTRSRSSAQYAAHAPAPRVPQEPVRPRGGYQ